jgi:tRNA pseudouridine38-40 synthase
MTRNCRLLVSYDGTDFHGFAEAAGVSTVMGALRATLEQILQVELDLTAAGRTDAGVHSWGQVVSGRFPITADLDRVQRSVNLMCRPAIAIRSIEWADDEFDARFSATSRAYRYDVWNDPHPNPLLVRTTWHVADPLDVAAMNDAAVHVLGQHDFASFCRRPKVGEGRPDKSLVRIVHRAEWHVADPSLVRFDIAATSFCHQMVRSIVGTLVDVGRGRRTAASMPGMLRALDRQSAGPVAPPTGLTLWHVGYDGTRWDS